MARLRHDSERSVAIKELGEACRRRRFFQTQEKVKFKSNDVYKPVRYGTSLKDRVDKVQFWRVFLKHYAYPLDA
ncbi:hypothetical protein DITRI_Ditri04bG0010300 [Diplodiscus trichospermus]